MRLSATLFSRFFFVISTSGLSGCALVPPKFDVPTNEVGTPLTLSITRRIRCELVSLIFEEVDGKIEKGPQHDYLLTNDYQVAMLLYLNVTDKAGLLPAFTFPDTAKYVFGLNGQADLQREDTLSMNLNYSIAKIRVDYLANPAAFSCPTIDTNLSGDLGLKRSVSGALATYGLKSDTDIGPLGGEFSGTVQFVSNLGITNAGPTWAFRHFTGPGTFASISRANTDRISYGFAKGKSPSPYYNGSIRAKQLVQDQIQNDTGASIAGLRNILR